MSRVDGTFELTDERGRFVAESLARGSYRVVAHRRGGGTAVAREVDAGGFVRLQIPKVGSLGGSVNADDARLEDAFSITLWNIDWPRTLPFATTRGDWRIEGVHAGTYAIEARAPGHGALVVVELAPGEHRDELRIDLRPSMRVTGRLVDVDGRAIEGGWTTLRPSDVPGLDIRVHTTGEDGRFWHDVPAVPLTLHAAASAPQDAAASAEVQILVQPSADAVVSLGEIVVIGG